MSNIPCKSTILLIRPGTYHRSVAAVAAQNDVESRCATARALASGWAGTYVEEANDVFSMDKEEDQHEEMTNQSVSVNQSVSSDDEGPQTFLDEEIAKVLRNPGALIVSDNAGLIWIMRHPRNREENLRA